MNYDPIAKYYDPLSRMVFGKAQVKAQTSLLSAIPGQATVLIVGGGTGWILESIAAIHPTGLNITYWDSSVKMIELARKRNTGSNEITFMVRDVADAISDKQYDVLITPFLFDNFTESTTESIFNLLQNCLNPDGLWLYCDFRITGIIWQRILLKLMYTFFRRCCRIDASQMPDVKKHFHTASFGIISAEYFMNGFIESIVYKRSIMA